MKQGKKKYMLEMMEKLLPCRKCGKPPWAEEYGRGIFHIVEIFCSNKKCGNCEAWSRKEINNAIKAWNEREEEGINMKKNLVEVEIEIDDVLKEKLLKVCEERGITVDEFIEKALKNFIEKYKKESKNGNSNC